RVPLARSREQKAPALERERLVRVVGEEVDRLADVRVRLHPRLRALANLKRGQLTPPPAKHRRRFHECGGPLAPRPTTPPARARLGDLDRTIDVVRRPAPGPPPHPIRPPRARS